MQDRIEEQITINAPLDRVWELVSEPGWWVPSTLVEPINQTPGHQVVRESAKWGRFPIEVVRLEPKTYAAFRWASHTPGSELRDGNTTLVEFTVVPAGGSVTVTVVESGFAALPPDVREHAWKENTSGWRLEMAGLKARAEGHSEGPAEAEVRTEPEAAVRTESEAAAEAVGRTESE